jgi:hypothetical protein
MFLFQRRKASLRKSEGCPRPFRQVTHRLRRKPKVELLENRLAPAVITVTSKGDTIAIDGLTTLREAITSVNNQADVNGDVTLNRVGGYASSPGGTPDVINFSIPSAGVQTIAATGAAEPTIVRPLTINGYTQVLATANTLANADNAVILIQLDGTGAGTAVNGLTLGAGSGGSTIEGLDITNFQANASFIGGVGILVQSNGNTIVGNFVGVNPAGTAQLPNGGDGIRIVDASNNQIGGTNPADRNLASGNILDGIHVEGTLTTPATGNLIQGNFVGVAADGKSRVGVRTAPVPNAAALGTDAGNFLFGIEISGGNNNTVGGTGAGTRNVVGFNGAGIEVDNGGQSNLIQGNFSGVGADGVTPVKNLLHGIVLRSSNGFNVPLGPAQPNEPGVSFNLIGGTVAGAGNLVEFNGTGGIAIFGNPVSASGQPNIGNSIEGDSIFQNGRNNPSVLLGIDLTNQFKFPPDDGVTPNDSQGHGAPNDPNNFQNFPVLTAAMPDNGKTDISGLLRSSPNSAFRIEFFANDADPAGGISEGQQFLGFVNVTTDANGNAMVGTALNVPVAIGRTVTATATDAVGNTSEFSAAIPVLTAPQRFVRALFLDELGRSGDLSNPNDAGAWVNALTNHTLTPADVAAGLEHAPEARTHLVTGWFQTYLGRLPANGEEQGLVTMLLQGQTEEQVLSRILGSQEFFNHAQTLIASGTPQERLVQALYQLLLKRAGSPGEVAGWIKVLPQLGAQGMALDFLTSSEFRINLFTSYYNTLLHRPPDTIGLVNWILSNLDADTVRLGIESSAEFFANG